MPEGGNLVVRKKKVEQEHLCKVVVIDEEGMLSEQDFYIGGGEGVEVQTRLGLGGEPLALAGVMVTSAHSLLMTAQVPENLIGDAMVLLKQIHALQKVRMEAANQKRLDRRDRGVSDDWPIHDDDSSIPF